MGYISHNSLHLNSTLQLMSQKIPITIAYGDGIGPEIMKATLRVLEASGAELDLETIEIGEKVYTSGHSSGIRPEAWGSLRKNRIFLKAPITTPQGGGVKSLNVTIRKTLGLYANIRPNVSYHPFVKTHFPSMDVLVVRENEEDTYAGIEHQQTQDVTQCLKLISTTGSERIIRYAFELARQRGRKKVTCVSKDNIMKITDGIFHKIFDQVATEYSDIESNHMIVDIGMAKLAANPYMFDVVVLPNLYGDILSDVAAEITGSVGLAPSANIGKDFAMFEAIHGSAPDIAGKDIANPSGLLLAACNMLAHIGMGEKAELIHNAWLVTIEEGIHTADIFQAENSTLKVGTQGFADHLIENLGKKPHSLPLPNYGKTAMPVIDVPRDRSRKKETIGVDVFLDWNASEGTADELAELLKQASTDKLGITLITNRGVKVWPEGFSETYCTDHWRCRFYGEDKAPVSHKDIIQLLNNISDGGLDFIKMEHLCTFDGKLGYSLGQGE